MISEKIASDISAIKPVRNFASLETLLTIYCALPEFLEITEPRCSYNYFFKLQC